MTRVAAVTMVYNEPEYLPIWCRYYGHQVGPQNCYIIDHGSDDGSTRHLDGFNVIRIPRSPKDNAKRTRFVSRLCSNLLEWFDWVLHSDVDEVVVADMRKYSGLREYLRGCPHKVVNAIGMDIAHDVTGEPEIVLDRPVLEQRRWMRFSSSMCKPVVASKPIEWSPGFHSADAPLQFGELFLFHLRYFDLASGLRRLAQTRAMAWSSEQAGRHQRVQDEEFERMLRSWGRLPRTPDGDGAATYATLARYVERVRGTERDHATNTYNLDIHVFGDELMWIPREFRTAF